MVDFFIVIYDTQRIGIRIDLLKILRSVVKYQQ